MGSQEKGGASNLKEGSMGGDWRCLPACFDPETGARKRGVWGTNKQVKTSGGWWQNVGTLFRPTRRGGAWTDEKERGQKKTGLNHCKITRGKRSTQNF